MKFARIIWANLNRKVVRLILTIGSFAVALFLFAFLAVVNDAFGRGADVAGADRLVVINRTSIINPLLLSYKEKILKIPGVKYVTHNNWFGGIYQDEKNFFPAVCDRSGKSATGVSRADRAGRSVERVSKGPAGRDRGSENGGTVSLEGRGPDSDEVNDLYRREPGNSTWTGFITGNGRRMMRRNSGFSGTTSRKKWRRGKRARWAGMW